MERKRRQEQKTRLQELRDVIPILSVESASMASVLVAARDHILELTSQVKALEERCRQLEQPHHSADGAVHSAAPFQSPPPKRKRPMAVKFSEYQYRLPETAAGRQLLPPLQPDPLTLLDPVPTSLSALLGSHPTTTVHLQPLGLPTLNSLPALADYTHSLGPHIGPALWRPPELADAHTAAAELGNAGAEEPILDAVDIPIDGQPSGPVSNPADGPLCVPSDGFGNQDEQATSLLVDARQAGSPPASERPSLIPNDAANSEADQSPFISEGLLPEPADPEPLFSRPNLLKISSLIEPSQTEPRHPMLKTRESIIDNGFEAARRLFVSRSDSSCYVLESMREVASRGLLAGSRSFHQACSFVSSDDSSIL
ncbi:uncharacterized protein BJ171DRAFT_248055 [Polychytrium aggregatum]|uniref:uncharacterized protein n=1 Tax=Polychytrium aggregatum TaxID=110093 RepID=UPI0022FF31DE|nr:uncharacterized protein BJ171DRAFT_248055 [Polychytrium aggregatum]KAI9193673.1 hypothetical protein BJ171DRAFT_248055 [Polychytrium aggregatum]